MYWYAYLFSNFCHPACTFLEPACISILGSNASLHVNWAYLGINRLVLAVGMLLFCLKKNKKNLCIHEIILFYNKCLWKYIWAKKFMLHIFLTNTFINSMTGKHFIDFLTKCHPTLLFVPPENPSTNMDLNIDCLKAIQAPDKIFFPKFPRLNMILNKFS